MNRSGRAVALTAPAAVSCAPSSCSEDSGSETDDPLVGCTIRQRFRQYGWHDGRVLKKVAGGRGYLVAYDDGDERTISEREVIKWVAPLGDDASAAAAGSRPTPAGGTTHHASVFCSTARSLLPAAAGSKLQAEPTSLVPEAASTNRQSSPPQGRSTITPPLWRMSGAKQQNCCRGAPKRLCRPDVVNVHDSHCSAAEKHQLLQARQFCGEVPNFVFLRSSFYASRRRKRILKLDRSSFACACSEDSRCLVGCVNRELFYECLEVRCHSFVAASQSQQPPGQFGAQGLAHLTRLAAAALGGPSARFPTAATSASSGGSTPLWRSSTPRARATDCAARR